MDQVIKNPSPRPKRERGVVENNGVYSWGLVPSCSLHVSFSFFKKKTKTPISQWDFPLSNPQLLSISSLFFCSLTSQSAAADCTRACVCTRAWESEERGTDTGRCSPYLANKNAWAIQTQQRDRMHKYLLPFSQTATAYICQSHSNASISISCTRAKALTHAPAAHMLRVAGTLLLC